ncbi:DUF4148 domain-containing protein [Paraburkholderia sp. LEh10]|uniref:DUF4148 domain-containing protein n=1 Tax=Paraburkholderia sp. LEh10 TaxID=2821353 RepID=UPI001AE92B7E|nr:DUF4148 domain-containing protein [Paraburkholderia sp. LEh10]MBP0595667.1 DUF4148 domain-containing protein [Paraburkholderia sp. LEh10]
MKPIITFALASAVFFISAAQAQSLTRAEVKQQLIDAQANGLRYVTETSYPDVHPAFAHKFKVKAQASPGGDEGGVPTGSQQSGNTSHGNPMPYGNPHCVGPVTYCNIYAGS